MAATPLVDDERQKELEKEAMDAVRAKGCCGKVLDMDAMEPFEELTQEGGNDDGVVFREDLFNVIARTSTYLGQKAGTWGYFWIAISIPLLPPLWSILSSLLGTSWIVTDGCFEFPEDMRSVFPSNNDPTKWLVANGTLPQWKCRSCISSLPSEGYIAFSMLRLRNIGFVFTIIGQLCPAAIVAVTIVWVELGRREQMLSLATVGVVMDSATLLTARNIARIAVSLSGLFSVLVYLAMSQMYTNQARETVFWTGQTQSGTSVTLMLADCENQCILGMEGCAKRPEFLDVESTSARARYTVPFTFSTNPTDPLASLRSGFLFAASLITLAALLVPTLVSVVLGNIDPYSGVVGGVELVRSRRALGGTWFVVHDPWSMEWAIWEVYASYTKHLIGEGVRQACCGIACGRLRPFPPSSTTTTPLVVSSPSPSPSPSPPSSSSSSSDTPRGGSQGKKEARKYQELRSRVLCGCDRIIGKDGEDVSSRISPAPPLLRLGLPPEKERIDFTVAVARLLVKKKLAIPIASEAPKVSLVEGLRGSSSSSTDLGGPRRRKKEGE